MHSCDGELKWETMVYEDQGDLYVQTKVMILKKKDSLEDQGKLE